MHTCGGDNRSKSWDKLRWQMEASRHGGQTGDPGKGVIRVKGKMRETNGEWAGGREGGREEGGRNWHLLRGSLHAEAPALSSFFPTGTSAFPCCGKDSVDIVERA